MKKLLSHYGVSLFQLTRAFRNEEQSPIHVPEFTMLEWYRMGRDYRFLMNETEALVRCIASEISIAETPYDFAAPVERLTVHDAFTRYADLNLAHALPKHGQTLHQLANDRGLSVTSEWRWEDVFHNLLLTFIEPELGRDRPTFLYDYPVPLAALARVRNQVAERFELYISSTEICNGFSELTDEYEQMRRFESERTIRAELNRVQHAVDNTLIAALANLEPCTGNALGVDRLLMVLSGEKSLDQVTNVESPSG